MNLSRLIVLSLAAVAGALAVLALESSAQPPADVPANTTVVEVPSKTTVVELGPDNTLVERTIDGKVFRTTQRGANTSSSPWVTNGRMYYGLPGPGGLDAESQKLLNQERGAAQEARALTSNAQLGNSEAEKADAKKKLREKLVEIFDLQQERRNREIAKIEERLGKLKETLKKRDAAKDSIVDRRLETLTGGVDELGWEDSLANPANHYAQPPGASPYPPPVPVPQIEPGFAPPVPVAPRAGVVPVHPVPELPPSLDPTSPAPARAPVAPAAPAPPGAPALPVLPSPGL